MSKNDVGARIDSVLKTKGLARVVEAYFDPAGPFAGATFDTLEPGPPNKFTTADLLAASLLDVRVKPLALRQILGDDATELSQLLEGIPVGTTLWDATKGDLEGATALWDQLRRYKGIDWVIAGKLMARKRPHLIPIVDSVIIKALSAPKGGVWASLQAALSDKERRNAIEALRPDTAVDVSTLRILDVALWMLGSDSRNAKQARASVKK